MTITYKKVYTVRCQQSVQIPSLYMAELWGTGWTTCCWFPSRMHQQQGQTPEPTLHLVSTEVASPPLAIGTIDDKLLNRANRNFESQTSLLMEICKHPDRKVRQIMAHLCQSIPVKQNTKTQFRWFSREHRAGKFAKTKWVTAFILMISPRNTGQVMFQCNDFFSRQRTGNFPKTKWKIIFAFSTSDSEVTHQTPVYFLAA